MKLQLTAIIAILYINVSAQTVDSSFVTIVNPIGSESEKPISLPFVGIKIIDARFDRSNIGSVYKKSKKYTFRYIRTTAILPDSFQTFLPQIINRFAAFSQPNNGDTLVVLFKQFRIVEQLLNSISQNLEPQLLMKVSASFFRQRNDSLTRIFSVDDLQSIKWPNDKILSKERILEYRNTAFISLLTKLFQRENWETQGSSFPLSTVAQGIEKRFSIPLLTATSLQPGVYKSFSEFKNNMPSANDVQVKLNKGLPIALQDASGKELELKNYWGVCVNNKRFVIFRKRFYELVSSDRSFKFLSFSNTNDLAGDPSFGDLAPQTGVFGALMTNAMNSNPSRLYFYLNIDEEDIYLEEIFGKSNLKNMQKELLK